MKNKKVLTICILVFFIIALIIYHIFGNIGHYGYDDMEYARLANNLLHGIIDYNNHFTYRLPIILLTAFSYSIFGISDFASSLPPLLITISILLLVYSALKSKNYITLVVGLALTIFSNWFIFYSDKLMPDIYVAFSVMLSLFIINRFKFDTNKKRPVLYSFLFTLSLLFGFTAKETIILIIPLLFYFIIIDFVNKRDRKFWIYSLISGVSLLSIYFIIMWVLTGDFTKRFEAIAQNSYLNLCSYDKQSFQILLKRIVYEFFSLFISQAMFTGFIFVIAHVVQKRNKNFLLFNDSFSFYLVSSVILLLSSNFMTISVTSYIPMCLDPRHYLFLIPVVSIPAAIIITEYVKTKQDSIPILITFILVAIVSTIFQINAFWKLYLPLIVLFVLFFILKRNRKFPIAFIIIFVLILMVVPFDMIKYAKGVNYSKQKDIVFKYILSKNENCDIITNDVQKRICEYYSNFNAENNFKFFNFGEVKIDTLLRRKKLLLINGYTQSLSGLELNDLPYYAKNIDSANVLLYENKKLNIFIYELNKIIVPSTTGTEIVNSLNDFEKVIPFWDQNKADITKVEKYGGNNSYVVNEYSSTFEYPIDSLSIDIFNRILISTQLYCNFNKETKSKIVISLETKDGTYIWQGKEINKYLKAYSNWWPLQFDIEIKKKDVKPESILKIYLWNSDERKAYIDNFHVKIIGFKN